MVLARWLAIAGSLAVGPACRLHFDELPDAPPMIDAPDAPVGLGELPHQPQQICRIDRYAAATPAHADLAIAGTDEGYLAVWVDTERAAPAQALRIGVDHRLIQATTLPDLTDTRLGGMLEAGNVVMIASSNGTQQTISAVTPDLARFVNQDRSVRPMMGRDPFAYDSGATIAVVTADDHTLDTAYLGPSGQLRAPYGNPMANELLEFSCTLGPDHGHCMFTDRRIGQPTVCHAADISFALPTTPKLGTNSPVASDCHDVRTVSGAVSDDAMIGVWTTSDGEVLADYFNDKDITASIAPRGSAPKVVFDDNQFWIAWIDDSNTLGLRSFGALDAFGNTYPAPGWQPHGPEAFELVHRGTETLLAVVRDGELDLLQICPDAL